MAMTSCHWIFWNLSFLVNQQSFVLRAKVLFEHQISLFNLIFEFVHPQDFLRRCGNRTCPSRCGLSSWMRACCGRGPAGCGNSAQLAGPGRWRATAQRQRRPSAPTSGRKARDGRRLTRTACCWRGPQPSWAHPCLIVSAPALCWLLKDSRWRWAQWMRPVWESKQMDYRPCPLWCYRWNCKTIYQLVQTGKV